MVSPCISAPPGQQRFELLGTLSYLPLSITLLYAKVQNLLEWLCKQLAVELVL
jgi:hypothetical protein